MHKLAITAGALAMALGLGTGVAQDAATDYEGVDPSGQTVVFWHQHPGDREVALEEIVAEFNASNPYGITVEAEYQGGYDDIYQKMIPVLGTSDAPNLVVAYQNQAADYRIGNGVIDMRPLVRSAEWGLSEEELADTFFLDSDVFPAFGGERLGFPPNRSAEVLYYNADWLAELREAGAVSFEGPPATPEQFREAACAAAETPFSGATSEGSIGYELSIDASRFASWTFAFGGDVYDAEANEYTLDSEAAVQAMEFLQGLFEDGCASVVTERYGDQTNFGAGRTLFTIGSSSGLPFYRAAAEEGAAHDWSVAPLPRTTDEPVMNVYGASVSIPSGHTPEQELATWLFIKHYASPEVQAEWARASNYFPVRASAAEGLGDYFEADPAYEAAFELLQYGHSEPNAPGYQAVRDLMGDAMAAIVDGGDVQEELELADAEADLILDDQLSAIP